MNRKNQLTVCLMLLVNIFSFAQVRDNMLATRQLPQQHVIQPKAISLDEKYVDIIDYLPKGYMKDGSKDYTAVIQNVLDKNKNVRFPNFALLINEKGLTIHSNSKLFFEKGSQLWMIPNSQERYEILRLHNVSNIKLIGPTLKGDREKHKDDKGEWGMGISIRGNSSDIEIYNANISNCWGDGIYIGHLKQITPKNIKITNSTIDKAYRNGISITCGNNIEVADVVIMNSNYNGIKIEPSNSAAILKKIVFKNVTTFNNYDSGISVGGLSKLIGIGGRQLELEVINHTDDSSKIGMFFGLVSVRSESKNPLGGYIKIVNPKWSNNKEGGFIKRKFYKNVPNIEFLKVDNSLKKSILETHIKDKELFFK